MQCLHSTLLNPKYQSSKLEDHPIIGTFLDHTSTLQHIDYLETSKNKIMNAAHASRFDEGISSSHQLYLDLS
jgi:hypothetical protein